MPSVLLEERKRFGAAAGSMIPLVLVDSSEQNPQKISALFQKADLLTTLDYCASVVVPAGPSTVEFRYPRYFSVF